MLMKYKTRGKKALTDEQLGELFDFLSTVPDVKSLVMGEEFKFTESQYEALMKMMGRAGVVKKKAAQPTPEKAIKSTMAKRTSDAAGAFANKLFDDMLSIGGETVMRWYQFAGELGYYDQAKQKVDMPKFVGDAINFFIENKQAVTELNQVNVMLWSSIELLSAMFKDLEFKLNEARMAIYMTESLNPDLGLVLTPIKSRLGMS